jgi:hypothetical protein
MTIELKLMTSLDLLKPHRDSLSKECDRYSKRETLGTFGILGFVNSNIPNIYIFLVNYQTILNLKIIK